MIQNIAARFPFAGVVARARRAALCPVADTLTEYAVFVGGSRVSEFYPTADAADRHKQALPPTQRAAALILDDLGRCIIR